MAGRKSEPVITHQYIRRDNLVSFLDVVQAIGVHELRVHGGISLQKIRQAIILAERTYGIQYPFARNDFFSTWGTNVFIKPNDDIGYVEASGKNRGQRCFKFVGMYLKKIEFDKHT